MINQFLSLKSVFLFIIHFINSCYSKNNSNKLSIFIIYISHGAAPWWVGRCALVKRIYEPAVACFQCVRFVSNIRMGSLIVASFPRLLLGRPNSKKSFFKNDPRVLLEVSSHPFRVWKGKSSKKITKNGHVGHKFSIFIGNFSITYVELTKVWLSRPITLPKRDPRSCPFA